MTVRTSHKTVTFTQPFSLSALDEVQAAGTYTVETEEESLPGLSFPAWRRIATLIFLPSRPRRDVRGAGGQYRSVGAGSSSGKRCRRCVAAGSGRRTTDGLQAAPSRLPRAGEGRAHARPGVEQTGSCWWRPRQETGGPTGGTSADPDVAAACAAKLPACRPLKCVCVPLVAASRSRQPERGG